MAATTIIQDAWGATPTYTDITSSSTRFKHDDNPTADALTPMVKPAEGAYDRSYIKHLRLNCTVGPTNNITNGRFYLTNTNTGAVFYATAYNGAYQRYAGMSGPPYDATSGLDASYTANPSSGSPLQFLSSTFTTTGQVGYWIRIYLRVYGGSGGTGGVAAPGTLASPATFTFSYDET